MYYYDGNYETPGCSDFDTNAAVEYVKNNIGNYDENYSMFVFENNFDVFADIEDNAQYEATLKAFMADEKNKQAFAEEYVENNYQQSEFAEFWS